MKEQISFRTGEKRWKLAPVLVIAAGICWGVIGLFSYGLKDAGLSALQIAALRCLTAGLCLGGFLLLTVRRLLLVHPRDLWMFVGTGVVSFLFQIFYCAATCGKQMTGGVSHDKH